MVTAPFSDTAPELVAKVPVLAEASKAPLDNVKPSAAVTAPERWMHHPIDGGDALQLGLSEHLVYHHIKYMIRHHSASE